MHIVVLNGPNLNLLGTRQPDVYGRTSLAEIEDSLSAVANENNVQLTFFQSNSEGELIRLIQESPGRYDGIVINPGGLTHHSVSLLDSLLAVGLPAVEVHLTNLASREDFRRVSVTAGGVCGRVEGFGADGYRLALLGLVAILESQQQ